MHGIRANCLFALLAACVPPLVACTANTTAEAPRQPVFVRLVNAPPGSFANQLAREYDHVTGGSLQVTINAGTDDAIETVKRGDADITLTSADIAYFAYRRGGGLKPLRAVAALQVVPMHLIVSPTSGIHDVRELRGHRVGGLSGSPMADLALKALDVSSAVPVVGVQAANAIVEGKIDAAFVTNYYPAQPVDIATRRGARLIPIAGSGIERLRREYPFVRLVTIPANTYVNQTADVDTIGAEVVYLCREDLSEPVVHELTQRLFEALPTLAKSFGALRVLDVKQAPATPIPLHDGAARYYREIEVR